MKTAFTNISNSIRMMKSALKPKEAAVDNSAMVTELADLKAIHQTEKNVAIYSRSIDAMEEEIQQLLKADVQLKFSGTSSQILKDLEAELNAIDCDLPLFYEDVRQLLETFEEVSAAKSFRLHLFTVNSNMCRRFHTDINDLRLLCTYYGQGTFWLPEEAADRKRHHHGGDNEEIVIKPDLIQQVKTGEVIILKGALYPCATAALHRSPSIEESEETRLLFRIDTNEFANFG